jgi:hypothetical protein
MATRVNYAYRDESAYSDDNLGYIMEQDILDAETTGSLVDHRAIADDPVETLFRQLRYPTRDAPVFPVALPPQFREIC